jgi:hypothetical protein
MYIAYSNSTVNSNHHRFSQANKVKTKSIHFPKKAIRFFIALLVLTLVFSFGALVQAYAGSTDSPKPNGSSISNSVSAMQEHARVKVIVNQGDTLWDIASMHITKNKNIRSYVAEIKKLNGLASSSINEGDVLFLP